MLKTSCIAFVGARCVARGPLAEALPSLKRQSDLATNAPLVVLDAESSFPLEVDLRGSTEEIRKRLESTAAATAEQNTGRGPGRPKLGVTAREVTLLPRHWEWLNSQPGGASVTLRKLVEQARKASAPEDELRRRRESLHRFMTALGGDLKGYEEALRALYAGDEKRFRIEVSHWPVDLKGHALSLAKGCFAREKT